MLQKDTSKKGHYDSHGPIWKQKASRFNMVYSKFCIKYRMSVSAFECNGIEPMCICICFLSFSFVLVFTPLASNSVELKKLAGSYIYVTEYLGHLCMMSYHVPGSRCH